MPHAAARLLVRMGILAILLGPKHEVEARVGFNPLIGEHLPPLCSHPPRNINTHGIMTFFVQRHLKATYAGGRIQLWGVLFVCFCLSLSFSASQVQALATDPTHLPPAYILPGHPSTPFPPTPWDAPAISATLCSWLWREPPQTRSCGNSIYVLPLLTADLLLAAS